ncbi:hypothetical protein AALO_G00162620 [Alosa alosa]|uniref:Zinc finger and BTB domain-containing protein 7C n=1 Tax=Alosa alosa TaxID=278164 RepID=A0AAV6GF69_9TELE|nr:zinc finger and BTB domain-containing protein 7C [Alosa alosa]XP_048114176.1 zinc finger and BTB domain-containing protein 7C [Alosa alosa]XP_048114177.1 zinc finger and BTB domain-containing protein 7C [Alosa alosa]XP_048114178.1 zinc finger and BTB domain-containing protein 7C [Alosa alosa]KAG5272187.1 hypothetical protein AALO_G00162620 [Alosa alosa]
MMAYREEDLIGIPFPNHSSDVLCSLNEQRREGLLCDVVLIVQDQEYHTHRSVLAACSQYFKKLFTVATDTSESHAVYQIDFVGPESLTAILEFAYTSTLTVTASNVKQILNAAQMLEIPCIINVCLEIMDGGGGEEGGGGEGGGGGGGDHGYEEEEEEDEDDEEEEDDMEDDAEESREEEPEEPEDDTSEKSTQASEHQEAGALEQGETAERGESPPCSSKQEQSHSRPERRCQEESPDKGRDPDGLEGRALKDFSIESLLQEGLYPKMPGLERGSGYSPLLPGFYPPMWAAEFPTFPQILEPHHAPHPYGPQMENTPLDLAVKKEVIQEDLKEEVAPGLLHRDFLKEFMGPGLGVLPEAQLSQIKDEADLRSYLSFLSASHLGVFPPWQLEEERKLKPKASQQCPICNKVIQGAGKLPRHMRTHTGEKPYMCTICEVRFTRQDKLKIHMRKHTGERPYICLHCNSKFVHNYDLKNHLRIHTGVRPYQCEHCYKSFTRSDHLHRHLKRQSCRVSRPRRGRKPAAWRASNFLYPTDPHLHQDKGLAAGCRLLPTPLPALGARGLAERRPQGGRALEDCEGGGREAAEARLVDRSHMAGEAERKRGVFSFTLARDDVLPHAPFPFPAPPPPHSDPWTVRLDRAPPIPEAAN